jgi:3-deoxy-D-manno-octulosonic-acid transferase
MIPRDEHSADNCAPHSTRRTTSLIADWPLIPYNALIILLSPLLLLVKLSRFLKKKRGREFDVARWTCPVMQAEQSDPNLQNLGGRAVPHVVLIGTGFGEMRIVEQLAATLTQIRPGVRTTWVLRDREAVLAVQKAHPHQSVSFLPFDFIVPVLTWLRRLSPDVIVLVEKFWFPNLVRCSADWGAKVMVANARTRSHQSLRYRILSPFHRWVVSSFERMYFQSPEDVERARPVLSSKVDARVPGNIKFALPATPDPARVQALQGWLAGRGDVPLLVAGSTSGRDDEEFVLRAFQIVRAKRPCALLIAPRRLHKIEETLAATANFNLKVSRRTQPRAGADVYILDTMGELAAAYQFAVAAFVGGTITGAGHNVAEPLVWGVPVSYGPSRGFFESVQKACEAAEVGFRIHSPAELAAHWLAVLEDADLRDQVRVRAAQLLSEQSGALMRNAEAIAELVDTVVSSRTNRINSSDGASGGTVG